MSRFIPRDRRGHRYPPESFSASGPWDLGSTTSAALISRWRADSVSTSGASVTGMADIGGGGRHQTSDGADPTLNVSDAGYNNRPTVVGSVSRLKGTAGALISAPVSLLVVGQAAATTALLSAGDESPYNLVWKSSLNVEFYALAVTKASNVPGTKTYLLITDDGSAAPDACKMYVGDFTTPAATGVTCWGPVNTLSVGMTSAGVQNLSGKFADSGVWSGVLSLADRVKVEQYVKNRYGA